MFDQLSQLGGVLDLEEHLDHTEKAIFDGVYLELRRLAVFP